jgi:hypothetical protein
MQSRRGWRVDAKHHEVFSHVWLGTRWYYVMGVRQTGSAADMRNTQVFTGGRMGTTHGRTMH